MYDLNGAATLATNVYASDGTTLQDAATVTVTITLPDGTVQGPTAATHGTTGHYTFNPPTSQAGRYSGVWISTSPNDEKSFAYDVRAAASTQLLSLTDARATLNIPSTDTSNDEEIRDTLDVVTALIDARIGYVIPRSVSETVEMWRDFFYTRQPIISLTSLTPIRSGGMTLTASDYTVLSTGKVVRQDGAWIATAPWNLYTAVYQAGRSSFSPLVLGAARVMLQHLWEMQRSDFGAPSLGDDEALPTTGAPVLTPRALEMLEDELRIGIG